MKVNRFVALCAAVVIGALAATAALAASTSSADKPMTMDMSSMRTTDKAADLRVTLNRLFGEHVELAIQATQAGYAGQPNAPALARSLDRNSVQIAAAIGSVYGPAARNKFLNGRFMWRDHIRFFGQYAAALAMHNKTGQARAVSNLKGYIEAFSGFLATATGLPQSALRASITEHVMQLKGQLDAYSQHRYAKSYALEHAAYVHMGMTADTLAAAIVKKFPAKF